MLFLKTTILESRDACEIKLRDPLKFVTGRIDCNNENEEFECLPDDKKEEYRHFLNFTCLIFAKFEYSRLLLPQIYNIPKDECDQ